MTPSVQALSAGRRAADAIDVVSTGAALGAEVRAGDLRALDDAAFKRVLQAWHDHAVVLFRDQALSDADLIAFSRRFGDLDWAPIQETGRRFVEGMPEIYIVSNVKVNGEPIGSLGDGEAVWHTDMSYLAMPPKASMLYSLEIPNSGGNTSFCSMYAIYDALPAELKERIAGLEIKHDGTYNSGGYLRQGVTPTDDPHKAPGAWHPAVCVHPVTGVPALYLGRRRNSYVEGLSPAESDALLDQIWEEATRPEFAYEHKWQVGDLLLWDNCSTQHLAVGDYALPQRRLMHRTTVGGSVPF
jgi:taurine dioxygenase